ncbi:MAG TPA: flavin reductase family protein [Ktedonobacteraceae bacterium]|jgi:flavin reductase ActVB
MIGAQDFKQVMARLAGAVSVITTCDEQHQPWGFTASAFCSLSLEPPLILFCLHQEADCYQAFLQARFFALNLLSEHQRDLAQRFAQKGRTKYQETTFVPGTLQVPLLPATLATLECSRINAYPGGDHCIFTGLVEYSQVSESHPGIRPLLYATQTYGTFTALVPGEKPAHLPDQKESSA